MKIYFKLASQLKIKKYSFIAKNKENKYTFYLLPFITIMVENKLK